MSSNQAHVVVDHAVHHQVHPVATAPVADDVRQVEVDVPALTLGQVEPLSIASEYSGAASFAPSKSGNVVVRVKPLADAGGPYTINGGDPLALDASGSNLDATSRVRWDVNGDGDFSDATGVNPTLTWGQLQTLGIQPGHTYKVRVKIRTSDATRSAKTTLTVTPA